MKLRDLFFGAFASRPRPLPAQILRPAISGAGERLRDFLAKRTSTEITASDLRTEVEGNLWMLTPEAFLYFLPAFMDASLESYGSISAFVSELLGALTEPSQTDVVAALDRLAQAPPGLALSADMTDVLRRQQLEWFDSGTPQAMFHERFDGLTAAEGAAVLAFLVALRESHGQDYPFREIDAAIDRHWARFRPS